MAKILRNSVPPIPYQYLIPALEKSNPEKAVLVQQKWEEMHSSPQRIVRKASVKIVSNRKYTPPKKGEPGWPMMM